jgi:hypothetical protein
LKNEQYKKAASHMQYLKAPLNIYHMMDMLRKTRQTIGQNT